MFGDFFDTEDDVLNGRGEQLLSHNQCKPKNCASNLDLPELKRKNKEFIGLKNQGATCYLNSLIQSLFMSPEFRQAIFKLQLCNNNDISQRNEIFSEGKFIILYALQQLLAEMQLLDCRAVSTENMTKSFGWEDIPEEQQNMAQQQQDVQEAQRVLFDVLNRALVDTEYAKLISSQYEGLQVNHITCLECKMSKETAETYCDLLLQVKGFENLEESLVSYITPELLNEKNQYYCDTCQKKVDAYKGVKIRKFPNILTISLNRYDFNYKTFERIKVQNCMTQNYYNRLMINLYLAQNQIAASLLNPLKISISKIYSMNYLLYLYIEEMLLAVFFIINLHILRTLSCLYYEFNE